MSWNIQKDFFKRKNNLFFTASEKISFLVFHVCTERGKIEDQPHNITFVSLLSTFSPFPRQTDNFW